SFSRDWSSDVCSSDLITTDTDGYVWVGSVMPAAVLQDLDPETFLVWGALPAGEIRLTVDVVSLDDNTVLASDSIRFDVVDTESEIGRPECRARACKAG